MASPSRMILALLAWTVCGLSSLSQKSGLAAEPIDFRTQIAPLLEVHCLRCHQGLTAEGGLDLSSIEGFQKGGNSGPLVDAQAPAQSLLLEMISGDQPAMPQQAEPLTPAQVQLLKNWIQQGASWPAELALRPRAREWWSLAPIAQYSPPLSVTAWPLTPIDAFIEQKWKEQGLHPSPEASRTVLLRRLSYDLRGLPPTPEEVAAFNSDSDPLAYEKRVEEYLNSPQYGERWARHWLDVVHYGDTHGYDKDQPRPNAWPYRDYVIQSLNEDLPYSQFVREQIAGDHFVTNSARGLIATGFLAAGPWDQIGHAEVPESKTDGKIARLMDRDDMVSTTLNTFCSLTVQCARCHDHKFDPVTQRDYYRLQAVFAAIDRTQKSYDADPAIAARRRNLLAHLSTLQTRQQGLEQEIAQLAGPRLVELNRLIESLPTSDSRELTAQFGYHSHIESQPDRPKWVQLDFGHEHPISTLEITACHDTYNHIGEGFGFPPRYKIEASNDPTFRTNVVMLVDKTQQDVPNPRCTPQQFALNQITARYVRVTATKLAPRQNDYIFALAEIAAIDPQGKNLARTARITSLDSIEAPPRWGRQNLVDGYSYGRPIRSEERAALEHQRQELLNQVTPHELAEQLQDTKNALMAVQKDLASLPPQQLVYCGAVHTGKGAFTGTGANGGQPRTIHVLQRGDVQKPLEEVQPGISPLFTLPNGILTPDGEFVLPSDHREDQRRAALAEWIVASENPLTWRTVVNRVWLYHFGRGLVDSPNDFGRMGQLPSHPELLDWLARDFRDNGQSLKKLHRLIVTSRVYRQSSAYDGPGQQIDAENRLYWRMNRKRLEAEAVRDAMLVISGRLNPEMGGPAFQDFVIEKPQHSPHYRYELANPLDPRLHRRSVYRFLVRSQTQPFMTTLDCADPSMSVDKRNETLSPVQSLALLNNSFVLAISEEFAKQLQQDHADLTAQLERAISLAFSRPAERQEVEALATYAQQHGLPQTCRILLNLNEFVFVD